METSFKRNLAISDLFVTDSGIELSFSSEYPVSRNDAKTGKPYLEILDHSSLDCMNLERAVEGLPLLWNHDTSTFIGRCENLWIDLETKKGRCFVQFSSSDEAQALKTDVEAGTLQNNISFGYLQLAYEVVRPATATEPEIRKITKWLPYEVSIAPLAADPTVGFRRSLDTNVEQETEVEVLTSETPLEPETKTELDNSDAIRAITELDNSNKQHSNTFLKDNNKMLTAIETLELRSFAESLNLASEFGQMVSAERSREEISSELLSLAAKRNKVTVPASGNEYEQKDVKNYSISKAMRALVTGKWDEAGLERELSADLAKRMNKETIGFYAPTMVRNTPATTVSMSGAGAPMVFNQNLGFIDMFRNSAQVIALGATVLPVSGGTGSFVRQKTASTVAWVGETPASPVAGSVPAFELVSLTPKTAMAQVAYSRQMLLHGVGQIDGILTADLTKVHSLAVDVAALSGTGGAQPTGLLGTTGVLTDHLGTAGNPTFANLNNLKAKVAKAGADLSKAAYLTTAELYAKLETIQKANGLGFILDAGKINGYTAAFSQNVPIATANHTCIFGAWDNLVIADFGALEFTIDPYTQAGQGIVNIVTSQMIDVAVKQPTAFAFANNYTVA